MLNISETSRRPKIQNLDWHMQIRFHKFANHIS